MTLSINSNIASLSSQRDLSRSTNALGTSFKRLSSGLRINSAKDDAAGLSISTRMEAQIRGASQSIRNVNDAISLIQVADSGLEQIISILQDAREINIQGANDTLNDDDFATLFGWGTGGTGIWYDMLDSANKIPDETTFNGQNILDGSFSGKKINIDGDEINIEISSAYLADLWSSAPADIQASILPVGGEIAAGNYSNASNLYINFMDGVIDSALDIRSYLGSLNNRLESVSSSLFLKHNNTMSARSVINDTDIAHETAQLTRNSIIQQASVAILAQANQQPQIALQLLG